MALSEKELENQLTEAGNKLFSSHSSVTQLISSLDRVESLLARVEQSPSESMRKALSPSMKALIGNELLRHSDIDVRVAVASCISEITRITAPDAPYDDDQMKEVFQLIVSSFEKLEDQSSPSFVKRTSILETVAKVRSCVVMLDLECDALIAEMFQHFFNSIRSSHLDKVFSSMETIMTLVLEESEEVSADLVSIILNVLKTENKEILPIARQLGEKVFIKCSTKIEPCLEKAMKSLNTTRDDYPKVVANVFKERDEGTETKDVEAASKKADENEVANEPTKTEAKVTLETTNTAPRCEELVLSTGESPKPVVSNGTIPKESEDTSSGNGNTKDGNTESRDEELEPEKTKVEKSNVEEPIKSRIKPGKVNKRKGKKKTSSKSSSEPSELAITDEKDDKEDNESPEIEKELEPPVDVPSSSPSGKIVDGNASKKVESGEKKEEFVEDVPNDDLELKESDVSKKEDEKLAKQSGKKVQISSQREDRKKRGQGKVTPKKDPVKSPAKDEGKKSVDSSKSAKDESDVEKASKSNPKRKRSSEKKSTKHGKELVGSKVEVWWPDDQAFYAGVIEHFDPSTGKHKITYNDGDVEVLKLADEKWKFVDGSVSDQEHSSDDESPDETVETPKAKKAKTNPVATKQDKTKASAKKGGALSSKTKAVSKSASKKEDNKSGGKTKDATPKSKTEESKGGKTKDTKSSKTTPKSVAKSKENEREPLKGKDKSKQETLKEVIKSKTKSPKSSSKSTGKSKAKASPLVEEDEDDDEENESSPEPLKTPESKKGKSGSKSQKSSKKRKR